MRFFSRKRDVIISKDIVPDMRTSDRYGDNKDEQSLDKVITVQKHNNPDDGASKKKDKDNKKKKKKKKKSKKDREKRKSMSSASKLVDRVPTVESCDSANPQDLHGEKGDVHVSIASDDDGDDRYSVAGHLSRGGRSSAGMSVLSDDSDEYGARWRSWDDDEETENRDANEVAVADEKQKTSSKKKKKKKHRSKSRDKSGKKKKKNKDKKTKSKSSDDGARDQPDDHENHSDEIKQEPTAVIGDSLIQVRGATATDGEDHSLIEEVEIEHLFSIPAEAEERKGAENPVESLEEHTECREKDAVENRQDEEKTANFVPDEETVLPYTKSIIPDDTFEVDNDDGVVTTLMTNKATNKKELLELDEYSVHDVENQSALGQCLRFYSCNGIARLLEFQPKLLRPATTEDSKNLPTAAANQNFELLLGAKSPVASGPPETILVSGFSEDSLDMLHEAPSLDTLKRNPSVVIDLTGKNLCLDDDESLEDNRSRKTGKSCRRRKRTPRNNHKVTVTSIEIPEAKTHSISDNNSGKSKKSLSVTNSDKTLTAKNRKAPKRGMWGQRRQSTSDDRSVRSGLSDASSKGSKSITKKRVAQSFFLRIQGKRAQC